MLAALESSTSFSVPTRPPSAPSSSSLFLDQSARLSLPDAIHFSEFPECQLLGEFGGFGWWIQGALGLLSFSSLLIKRFRERPRRSWKVFILDSSKQATGAFTIHMLNLIFAALLSWHGTSDPCNWYWINIVLDTTLGVLVVFVLLQQAKKLGKRAGFQEFGYYGDPPMLGPWLLQLFVWQLLVIGMKLVMVALMAILKTALGLLLTNHNKTIYIRTQLLLLLNYYSYYWYIY
eukprot:GHVT01032482.1.p1 GENE.GHVT01032482.1~~GHVT01032482.1.p1  ORF type:complete len:233 (+),score=26.60 GHVT01032482.1:542-1240(+)